MALNSEGLSIFWNRIKLYVSAYISERLANDPPTPIATTEITGKVKPDGTTLTIDEDGTLHGVEQTPIATTEIVGKVKPDGTTLTIDEDGTLHGVEALTNEEIDALTPYDDMIPDGDTEEY